MSTVNSRNGYGVALAGAAMTALALVAGCASQPAASLDAFASAPQLRAAHARRLNAEPAAPSDVQPDAMTLGEAAPAPLGFLKFCGRRPDQCGLDEAVDSEALTKTLVAKYYWAVAFASSSTPSLSLTPASGQNEDNWGRAQTGGRFDWSTIFGPTAVAPPPPGPKAAAAEASRTAVAADAAAAFTGARGAWAGSATAPFAFHPTFAAEAREPAQSSAAWSATWGRAAYAASMLSARPLFAAWTPPSQPVQPAQGAPVTDRPLQADGALMAELKRVNDRVNDSIRYVSDIRQYGRDDYWTLPLDPGGSAAGDCKDYVLEKRRALTDEGVPAEDLSIAVVRTRWGEDHAVLLVLTDRGELVLDSLSSAILQWRKAPYAWVERQAPGQPLAWVKVMVDRRGAHLARQRVAAASDAADQRI